MIKEDYVSFETAKLLKEKGFDEICNYEWGAPEIDKGHVLQKWTIYGGQIKNSDLIDEAYAAPTLQMAMKWLREKHSIFIATEFGWFHGDYEYQASVVKMNPTIPPTLDSIDHIKGFRNKTCEIACEESIKYCLTNLI